MKSKKRVLIIVAIVLVIIIAIAGTVAGMVMTGRIAITSKQKLARGLTDLGSKISMTEIEEGLKEYEKLQETPFEAQTIIRANINKMELEDTDGMEEMIDEIKNVVNNTTITNTIQADLKNDIIKENLTLNLADIVKEISAEVEYNEDRLSLRSKELNENYITFTKSGVESDAQYIDIETVFEILESICQKETVILYLNEDEKSHFREYYEEIFTDYITEDIIIEQEATIVVEGKEQKCSNVNFTLNKNQIVELIGSYLDKLQSDEKGKEIITSKIRTIWAEFNKEILENVIKNLKSDLSDLDDTTSIKVSIYGTMFKTYGIDIEFNSDTKSKISVTLGDKTDELYIIQDGETLLKAVKTNNEVTITSSNDELSVILKINKEDVKGSVSLEINDLLDDTKFNVTLDTLQTAKTGNRTASTGNMQISITEGNNNIDITFNIDVSLRYPLDPIETETFTDSNSVNPIEDEEVELQEYLSEIMYNTSALMQDAMQNSRLVQMIVLYQYYLGNGGFKNIIPSESISSQTSTTFNNMFRNYIGTQKGTEIKKLLQTLVTNNIINDAHKVSISIEEGGNTLLNSTIDAQEITNALESNIDNDKEYTILVTSLDDQRFITGIQIKKV